MVETLAWANYKRYAAQISAILERAFSMDRSRKAVCIVYCGLMATLGFSFLL